MLKVKNRVQILLTRKRIYKKTYILGRTRLRSHNFEGFKSMIRFEIAESPVGL